LSPFEQADRRARALGYIPFGDEVVQEHTGLKDAAGTATRSLITRGALEKVSVDIPGPTYVDRSGQERTSTIHLRYIKPAGFVVDRAAVDSVFGHLAEREVGPPEKQHGGYHPPKPKTTPGCPHHGLGQLVCDACGWRPQLAETDASTGAGTKTA